jgi:hypothetical protein
MKQFFSMLMSDDGKNYSSTRFVMVFIAVICTLIVFGGWVILCVKQRQLIDIPQGVITLYFGAMGIVAAAKVTQSASAEKQGKPDETN